MIRIGNEYGIHALHRQVRIVGFAMHNADVALASLECPEPQEHQRQPADVLCQNATALADWRRKFECEVSRTASQIDNYVSGLQIQCLDDIGGTLPLVPFSLNDVQTRKGIKTLVRRVDEEKDRNGAQKEKGKFDAVAQSASTHVALERPNRVSRSVAFSPYFETGNFWSSAMFNMSTLTRGSPRNPRSAAIRRLRDQLVHLICGDAPRLCDACGLCLGIGGADMRVQT